MELKNIWTWIKDKAIWSFNNWWVVLTALVVILLFIWFIVTLTRSIFRGSDN